jgi:hypothetical protein
MISTKLAGAFDPAAQHLFRQGIKTLSSAMVRDAIARGADVTLYNPHSTWGNAIVALFMSVRSAVTLRPSDDCLGPRQADFDAIISMILDQEPDLLEKNNWGKNAADYAVSSPLPRTGATVVLHAIHQSVTQGVSPYQINFNAIFLALGKSTARDRVMNAIARVHDHVRIRLLAPETEIEIDLAKNHADKIKYWTIPFLRPDQNALPVCGDHVNRALNDFADALHNAVAGDADALRTAQEARTNLTRAIIAQGPKNN